MVLKLWECPKLYDPFLGLLGGFQIEFRLEKSIFYSFS